MKKSIPLTLLLILFSLYQSKAQITPQEAIIEMGRGINLGNTLEPPTEGGWNNPAAKEYYFDNYVEAGFKTIRVPVRWDQHTASTSPFTVDSDWMLRVEEVVDWGLDRGLYIIINMHHEDWFKVDYTNQRARFDSIWSQIAVHFKNKSEKLLFEIINEPRTGEHEGLTQAEIDELNNEVLAMIRKTNPTRIVIFSGKGWSNSADLLAAAVPDDDYLMGYFHSYDPWSFAGEGNGTWGSTSQKNELKNKFDEVAAWSSQNSVPILLGEFGAIKACDYNSRMRHYAAYVEECLNHNFVAAAWDDGGNFEIMKRADTSWNELKDILIYTTAQSPTNIEVDIVDGTKASVTWTNRTTLQDSLFIERRENDAEFEFLSGLAPDAESFTDTALNPNNYYYYRVIARFNDSIDLKSYPARVWVIADYREPYNNTIGIPGTVEAENYDIGGEGLTYHETTPTNIPGDYRPDEAVDIEARSDGGFHVGYVENGEWLEYTVGVTRDGVYDVTAVVASEQSGGAFNIEFPDVTSEQITVTSTGSWETTTEISTQLTLEAGVYAMRVNIVASAPFNLDKLIFEKASEVSETKLVVGQLYPNPANDILYLKNTSLSSNSLLEIISSNGASIKTVSAIVFQKGIDISNLPNGVYFIKTQGYTAIEKLKFLKM